jgi:hypothetical protein
MWWYGSSCCACAMPEVSKAANAKALTAIFTATFVWFISFFSFILSIPADFPARFLIYFN